MELIIKFNNDFVIINIKQEAKITEHESKTISKQQFMSDRPTGNYISNICITYL